MNAPALLFDVHEGVAHLVLNRPKEGNALTPESLVLLQEAWRRVENDSAIRVAVITGAGDRHFCTGASVEGLRVGIGTLRNRPNRDVNHFTPRMCAVSKPVLCVVNGLVNGGGLHFVADSDIVIAASHAAFMDSHVSVGQVSGLESIGIARRAGLGAALLLGLAGRHYRMPAERAHQLGMVDLIEPTIASAMACATSLAYGIARNSPQAVALTKRAIWSATEMLEPAAADFGWELIKSHWSHPDFAEGPKAFMSKRSPQWVVDAENESRSALDPPQS